MKKALMVMAAIVIGSVLVAATGFAAEKYSGFLGDQYGKLQRGPKGGVKMRWLKSGVDFSQYKKLMVDSVVFFYAPDAKYKAIDPQDMKELADAFNQEIFNALKDTYPIVSEPGPDVARLRIALTGIKPSKPAVSVVTSIVPVGLAISLVKKGATGGYSGSGATSAEFEAIDSTTNEVIALAVDDQKAGFTERFSKLGSAKEAFKFWAGRIKKFMDDAHMAK